MIIDLRRSIGQVEGKLLLEKYSVDQLSLINNYLPATIL